jgi:hypothetical protein
MAKYTPPDGNETILNEEEGSPSLEGETFEWGKLEKGKSYYFVGCH